MKLQLKLTFSSLIVLVIIVIQSSVAAPANDDDKPSDAPAPAIIPAIPPLPTGRITGDTVDCVNEKFFKIQRENPQYSDWLTDVQRTVEQLFAVRKTCDKAESREAECISAWNRSAGVQFLRLGLALFDQKNVNGPPLEILNAFLTGFQKCW